MGLINIVHPKLPPAQSSLQDEGAFKKVFEPKGWKQITAEQAVAHNQAISEGKTSPVLTELNKPAKEGK